MVYTATLTQKGQVTIPIEIRKKLGIKPYQKITFIIKNDEVTIEKPKSFLELRGSLKSHKTYSDEEADKAVLEYIKNEYATENS